MQSGSRNTIRSGIEPVDELLGGLEQGQLYLAHGEASAKSLFAIKFLIEGLKQGENGALVIRYSPEDAVRRFARLGYDCLEDVYSGRLVILEYSDDIIQKIGKLRELTPVLRELEWLLGETRPVRLIFDPVASVLAAAEGNLETRVGEFADWARSFGATVVLIADESNQDITKAFEPLIAESFRFDVRDVGERIAPFMVFEKSASIPDQAIEVDPSRGVFLLGREGAGGDASSTPWPSPPSVAELESIREELRAARFRVQRDEPKPAADLDLAAESSIDLLIDPQQTELTDREPADDPQTARLVPEEEALSQNAQAREVSKTAGSGSEGESDQIEPTTRPPNKLREVFAGQFDELSSLLDDLTASPSPLDLDLPEFDFSELTNNWLTEQQSTVNQQQSAKPVTGQLSASEVIPEAHAEPENGNSIGPGRARDSRFDSTITSRAVELLLHAPDSQADPDSTLALSNSQNSRRLAFPETTQPASMAQVEAKPGDFNILIIEDDPETCDLVTQTLADYSLEVVSDGVSGLAKLISFKPDLVVLDFDLPVIDGFKVLSLIRSALNVPIIILSGARMRAVDRVMASELGADYYLTKPFSTRELKYKARQLIARYRGISSWIMNPSISGQTPHSENTAAEPGEKQFTPYPEFAAEVDKRVKVAMNNGAPFSIVGCRLPHMTADGGRFALRLFEIVRGLARDTDLTTTNPHNDLVMLLVDAGALGARSFAGRLRTRVKDELQEEPKIWMRSFPDLEVPTEAQAPARMAAPGVGLKRRAGDQATESEHQTGSLREK